MTSEDDFRALDHDYLSRQRVSRQWSAYLAAFAAECMAAPDNGAVLAFVRSVGARLARQHPVGKVDTLEALEAQINAVLADMDWGWTRLSASGDHVVITHGACPNVLKDDDQQAWPPLMAEVLAGAYAAWMASQGSPGAHTVCRDPLASPLVFEHRA